MTEAEVRDVITRSLEAVLEEKGLKGVEIGGDPQLFGSGSIIDSLDLVGMIVNVEEKVLEKTGKKIEIVDENSVISEDSPFRTISSLSQHILKKIRES